MKFTIGERCDVLTAEELSFCRWAKPQTFAQMMRHMQPDMLRYCGQIATITGMDAGELYRLDIDGGRHAWHPSLLRVLQK